MTSKTELTEGTVAEYVAAMIGGQLFGLPVSRVQKNPVNLNPRMAQLAGGVHRLDGQLMVVRDVDRVLEIVPKAALAA